MPLLQPDYATFLDKYCNMHKHYLDATIQRLNVIAPPAQESFTCFKALEEDLFAHSEYYLDEKITPIVFDSGCSIAVTPYMHDFVGPIRPSTRSINSISSSASVEGEGEVLWNFVDDYGVTQQVRVNAFLVLASKVRLFSPQAHLQQYQAGSFTLTANGCIFTLSSGSDLFWIHTKVQSSNCICKI